MAITPVFHLTILKGKASVKDPEKRLKYIQSLPDGEYDEVIRKKRKIRSDNQNAWYWACIVGIPAQHFGYTPEEMHDAYKWKFLRRQGLGPETVASTATLSEKEFSEYCEKIIIWNASEYQIVIPSPSEVNLAEYEQYR